VSDREPKLLDSKPVYKSTKFTVMEERFELPSGQIVPRSMLHHPGAAVIIPQLPDGRLVLIEQYRYALRGALLEFPAGTIDPGETVESTAHRELKEEIGGESNDWVYLGAAYSTPGFTDELLHAYLARNVSIGETALETGEFAEPKIMSLEEVEAALNSGALRDMKTIVALSQARAAGLL